MSKDDDSSSLRGTSVDDDEYLVIVTSISVHCLYIGVVPTKEVLIVSCLEMINVLMVE